MGMVMNPLIAERVRMISTSVTGEYRFSTNGIQCRGDGSGQGLRRAASSPRHGFLQARRHEARNGVSLPTVVAAVFFDIAVARKRDA
ncbi:hypothetical protein [Amycolatopsis panacis]|uniref:Uncharacterized protein n=1 Tax=Amycolatopsis panacis TaxID=2340917 RepID=A0A419HV96_9PSEU|nr:hypothetical protein [Amycolatopsis panacis]RJQ80819.1 hypothetical protein D5S19_24560 [Amycolatopsis panacis]